MFSADLVWPQMRVIPLDHFKAAFDGSLVREDQYGIIGVHGNFGLGVPPVILSYEFLDQTLSHKFSKIWTEPKVLQYLPQIPLINTVERLLLVK